MKKHIRLILTICLALCMVLCLGLAVACQPDGQNDNTFTITVLDASGAPVANQKLQYCEEGGSCSQGSTDSKGKFTFDISTDKWKESPTVHVLFLDIWLEGYQVYNAAGTLLDYDDVAESYDDYVDHHTVKSVTYTLKKIDDIYTGYQYDVINFSRVRTYSTYVETNEAYLDVDVNGGQFDLSVKINGVAAPGLSTTLSSTNNSVHLEDLGGSAFNPVGVEFTVTPKNAGSDHLTLTVCPVYEIGGEDLMIIASQHPDPDHTVYLDVYKVYFSLGVNAVLAFSDPQDDNFSAIGGYSIKVTVGDYETTWNSASDITSITALNAGLVPVTFKFGNPDTANLGLLVKDTNATSSVESDITVGEQIDINLTSSYDWKVLIFVVPADGSYVINVPSSENATVNYVINESIWAPDVYYASENDNQLNVVLDDLHEGDVVEITFAVDYNNTSSNSCEYIAYVNEKTDSVTPSVAGKDDDGNNGGGTGDSGNTITLGSEFELTLVFMEPNTLTFSSFGTGTYTIVIEIDDIEELDYISYNSANLSYTESEGKYVFEFEVTEEIGSTVSLTFYSGFGTTCKVTVDLK